jgi:heterodisulfide reductase subunit A-like polyferredoxin
VSDNGKPIFVQCICTGNCPGFDSLKLWDLINYVRNELDVQYAIVHPQLCVDDGDAFWRDYAKPGAKYIVGGCDPRMQRKMYKDALDEVGVDFGTQIVPLDLRNMTTAEAIAKVTATVEELEAAAGQAGE